MSIFDFKQFSINDTGCAMKVGTDSVLLGAWAQTDDITTVLDIGTGSGLLSLMIAQRCPTAHITAIEIDPEACNTASKNIDNSQWAGRIAVICTDALSYEPGTKFDLIISNPPYFATSLKSPERKRSQARHVMQSTGKDLLGPVAAVKIAAKCLSDYGSLAMISPTEYDDQVTYTAEMLRLKIYRKCLVSTVEGKPPTRILWQISRSRDKAFQLSNIALRQRHDNKYTIDYIDLTKDFYLGL